ncbi:unnamed protein product [Linum trigynum]|uniref:Uncharacterized protein n=1 Tax=Linum trigynum TaxID=586398 RepID=A0AAV2EDH9_9ROSI
MRFFIWKCAKKAIATRERLFSRSCAPNPTCPLCDAPSETVMHCLFFCHHASATWGLSDSLHSLPPENSSFGEWFFNLQDTYSNTQVCRIVCCLWSIWTARNTFVFEEKAPTPASSVIVSGRDFLLIEEARKTPSSSPLSRTTQSHSQPRGPRSNPLPPPIPFSRLMYCDGSFVSDSSLAAYGITIANAHGQVYDGKADSFLCSHPIQAEAFGLLNAILIAAHDTEPTCIRTDCQVLTLALRQDPSLWPWQCRATIARMVSVIHSAPWIKVEFVPRRLNSLADWVAGQARLNTLPVDWIVICNIIAPLL